MLSGGDTGDRLAEVDEVLGTLICLETAMGYDTVS